MRGLFLFLLLILGAAAALAFLMQLDSGYVLIDFHGTSIETTVWVALLILVVGFMVFYYAGRALLLASDLVTRLRGKAPRRSLFGGWHLSRGNVTARGMLALQEGRWKQALRLLSRGARGAQSPYLNHILSARAAMALDDTELADGFLQLAADTPGAAPAVAIARAEAQLAAGNHRAALHMLESYSIDPATYPTAMRVTLQALEPLREWARIASLMPQARRMQVMPVAELDAREENALRGLLPLAGEQSKALRATWGAASEEVRNKPSMIAEYARQLSRAGAGEDALALLGATMKKQWDGALIHAYGLVDGGDPQRQLRTAESHLDSHGNDPQLLLALGRIALRNRLWGKARDYFERSLARNPSAECCAELARLCTNLGEHHRSGQLLQQAVEANLGALPALPMPTPGR
jgi:HemY protein